MGGGASPAHAKPISVGPPGEPTCVQHTRAEVTSATTWHRVMTTQRITRARHHTAQNRNDSEIKQRTNQTADPPANHSLNTAVAKPLAARATNLCFAVLIFRTSAAIPVVLGRHSMAVGIGGVRIEALALTKP